MPRPGVARATPGRPYLASNGRPGVGAGGAKPSARTGVAVGLDEGATNLIEVDVPRPGVARATPGRPCLASDGRPGVEDEIRIDPSNLNIKITMKSKCPPLTPEEEANEKDLQPKPA